MTIFKSQFGLPMLLVHREHIRRDKRLRIACRSELFINSLGQTNWLVVIANQISGADFLLDIC